MWISDEEASIRIGSHRNLLNRIKRDSAHDDVTIEPEFPTVDEDLIDPEVRSHVQRRTPRKTGPILSKRDAADATIVASLIGNKHAATVFSKTEEHISHISNKQSQDHRQPEPFTSANIALAVAIEEQRTKVRDLAFERLGTVMACLDETKIKKVEKARELAHIATQLATVADKMLPKDMQAEQNVHFHMFRPEVKKASEYEQVEVGEERVVSTVHLIEGEVSDEQKERAS